MAFKTDNRQAGIGLLEVMVATAILGILTMAFSTLISNGISAQKHLQLRNEIDMVRMLLLTTVDCEKTFFDAGINPRLLGAGQCSSTSTAIAAPYMALKNKAGNAIVPAGGTLNGWSIRAGCSGADQDIVVHAAKFNGATAVKDPFDNKALDWNSSVRLLFGKDTGPPLKEWAFCKSSFTAAPPSGSCSGGQVLQGYNPITNAPVCVPYESQTCPGNTVMNGIKADGTPNCTPVAFASQTCPANYTMNGIKADGTPNCIFNNSGWCPGQVVQGFFNANGLPICVSFQPPVAAFAQNCPSGTNFQGLAFDPNANPSIAMWCNVSIALYQCVQWEPGPPAFLNYATWQWGCPAGFSIVGILGYAEQ